MVANKITNIAPDDREGEALYERTLTPVAR